MPINDTSSAKAKNHHPRKRQRMLRKKKRLMRNLRKILKRQRLRRTNQKQKVLLMSLVMSN